MKLLDNAPITAKSLMPSLLGALFVSAMAGLFFWNGSAVRHAADMQNAAVSVSGVARDAWTDLARGHAALYRAINLKSQNVETAIVKAAKTESVDAVARSVKSLASLSLGELPLERTLVEKAGATVDLYAKAAAQAAEFVEEDAFAATMFMTDAEQKFGAAQKDVSDFVAAAVALNGRLEGEAQATVRNGLLAVGLGAIVAVLLSLAASVFFSRLISQPIKAMTAAMRRLASGDLEAELVAATRKDEVGAMGQALVVFRDNAREARRLQAEQERAQAVRLERATQLETLMRDFEAQFAAVVGRLHGEAASMREAASLMSGATERASGESAAAAAAAEEASANVQTVATAAEELAASIHEIGRQVQQSSTITKEPVEGAAEASRTVTTLSSGVDSIGRVVELISGIASQTNLLALNATIEAARAGEAGKGFAVVASEVKSLATQTAKATEDITGQIAAIQSSTEQAVVAIEAVGRVIGQVHEIATGIAAAVEEQGAATGEIARNVQEASQNTQAMSGNVAGVSTAVAESHAVADRVRTVAQSVGGHSDELRGELDAFLAKVKAV